MVGFEVKGFRVFTVVECGELICCVCIACRTSEMETCEVGEFGIEFAIIDDTECEEDPVPGMPLNVAPPVGDILEVGDTVLNMEVTAPG